MADIEVTITSKGKFVTAALIEKENKFTVIPVTEESNSRTANVAPHPLFDTLLYLAEGYGKIVREPKKNINDYHRVYMQRLWEWMMSAYTHKTVHAVYHYLESGSLLNDLTEVKVITLDDKGFIADKNPKPFVRFLIAEDDSEEPVRCWDDRSLQDSWIQYYRSIERPEVLDYLTGRRQRECVSHPKKIRNDGDSAKLFSGADKINFTYRGRFAAKPEAVTIGEESSQKIHSALNWIIRKQGKAFDSMTLVVWENSNKDIPAWDDGTEDIIGYGQEMEDASEEVYQHIMCVICPVSLSKPGLSYDAEDNRMQDRIREWVVDKPAKAFLFPAFSDRSTDIHKVLYYTKKSSELQPELIEQVLGAQIPMSSDLQKEAFSAVVTDTLAEKCDFETVRNIYENLNDIMEEHAGDPEPLKLDQNDIKKVFESSGVPAERMDNYDLAYKGNAGERTEFLAGNITENRKFNVSTPDAEIKVKPDRLDIMRTTVIDGRQCLVIELNGTVSVNGINVRVLSTE